MATFHNKPQNNIQVMISEDENRSLQQLFNLDPNSNAQQHQVPLSKRKLPKSFFVQPDHSSSATNNESFAISNNEGSNFSQNHFVIHHNKANSSPACLDTSYLSLASASQMLPVHGRQKSLDIANDGYSVPCHNPSAFNRSNEGSGQVTSTRLSSLSPRPTLTFQFGDLPPGFEMDINEENKVYFLNHQTKNTTWFDPRIPMKLQKWGMTIDQLQQVHVNYARLMMAPSPDGQAPTGTSGTSHLERAFSGQQAPVSTPLSPSQQSIGGGGGMHVPPAPQPQSQQPSANSRGPAATVHLRSCSQPASMPPRFVAGCAGNLVGLPGSGQLTMACSSSALAVNGSGLVRGLEGLHLGVGPQGASVQHPLQHQLHLLTAHLHQQCQQQAAGIRQHSHQGSMDSGVGQSVTGHSNPSANQTPEHFMQFYDHGTTTNCDPLGPEPMEGLAYTQDVQQICQDMLFPDLNLDSIDLNELNV